MSTSTTGQRRAIAATLPYGARHGPLQRAAALGERWIDAEMGRFAPWLAVAMMSGALLYLVLRTEPTWWLGIAWCVTALAALVALRGWRVGRAVAAMLLACAAGFLAGQAATWRALPVTPLPTRAVVLVADVQAVEANEAGRRLVLAGATWPERAEPLARTLRVRLHASDAGTRVEIGDRVRVRALLRPPSPPAVPGGWDLQRDAWFSGVAGYGRALGPVEVIARDGPAGLAGWWRTLREEIARKVVAGLPGSAGGIAVTLLTGSGARMPEADRAAFRDSGLAHLLAVAGLHIGAVMGVVFWGTRLLLVLSEHAALHWPVRAISAAAALLAGATYAAMTGGHVPVLRSLAMACLVTVGLLLGRRALSLRGLALAAAAILLYAPNEIGGVSFQMSFSAVLALITGFEALRPALARLRGQGDGGRRRSWGRHAAAHIAALALTSALAGTASAPYGAYHFGHVQLYYVAANLVAVPLCTVLSLPLGLAALALMPFGLEGIALAPMGWSIDAILAIARAVASWPAAVMAVPHLPGWGLAILSIGLAWLGLWRSRARLLGMLPILAGVASPLLSAPPDVLVSPDARLIGVRAPEGGVLLQSRSGSNAFVRDAMLAYWGARDAMAFPKPGAAPRPGLDCDAASCRAGQAPHLGLILRGLPGGSSAGKVECSGVAALISPEPGRGVCPSTVALVDRFSVWRDGAHAVWLGRGEGPLRILSDRMDRGDRPWVPPSPAARPRPAPPLPMAETDALPPAAADAAGEADQ